MPKSAEDFAGIEWTSKLHFNSTPLFDLVY